MLMPCYSCVISADTERAVEILTRYQSTLRSPEEQELKASIGKVSHIFQSELFQALLGKPLPCSPLQSLATLCSLVFSGVCWESDATPVLGTHQFILWKHTMYVMPGSWAVFPLQGSGRRYQGCNHWVFVVNSIPQSD